VRFGLASRMVFFASAAVVLMLLAWVGGAMNLGWMLLLTLFVAAERMLGAQDWMMHASAAVLLGAGTVEIVYALAGA